MKIRLLRSALASTVVLTAISSANAFTPVSPGNLQAVTEAGIVNLSWEWGNAKSLSLHGFEDDTFPPAGWQVRNTFKFGDSGNWMHYTQSPDEAVSVVHGGNKSVLVMIAQDGDYADPATFHQDEWLIVQPDEGSVYMDFWYYIYPELLEVGAYPDFPDHYYVHISRDGGQTWHELWDARWDMGEEDAVQQASLFLGEPADSNTLVAFNAVSGEEDSLYFLWSVDDVEFSSSDGEPLSEMKIQHMIRGEKPNIPEGITRYRKFESKASGVAQRAPSNEWLNNGNITYRVYSDGKIVGDYLKRRTFTDFTDKEPGEHNYSVLAWCEATDEEFDAADANVEIEEVGTNPARNLKTTVTKDDTNGKYTVEVTWEAPEGDRKPSSYNVYFNGKSIGMIDDSSGALHAGQTGLYKGIYYISIEAVYVYPNGVSPLAEATAIAGTVPTVEGITITRQGEDRILAWRKPSATDLEVSHYLVFRGDTPLDQHNTTCTFTDSDNVRGKSIYSVHVVYSDGTISLPAEIISENEEAPIAELPLKEHFDNGHLPEHWTSELVDPNDRIKDMYSWRFDNWFETEFPDAEYLNGNYASSNGIAAGMNKLENYLITPQVYFNGDNPGIKFTKIFSDDKPGPWGAAKLLFQVTTDGGETWNDIADLAAEPNGECAYVLPELNGKTAQFRWGFLGRSSGIAAVDDVEISNNMTISVEDISMSESDVVDVFLTSGVLVRQGLSRSELPNLPQGIYILRCKDKAEKFIR